MQGEERSEVGSQVLPYQWDQRMEAGWLELGDVSSGRYRMGLNSLEVLNSPVGLDSSTFFAVKGALSIVCSMASGCWRDSLVKIAVDRSAEDCPGFVGGPGLVSGDDFAGLFDGAGGRLSWLEEV